jgi:hypothetical protein
MTSNRISLRCYNGSRVTHLFTILDFGCGPGRDSTAIASHAPDLGGGRWNGPCNRRQGPVQRRERIGPTTAARIGGSGLALYLALAEAGLKRGEQNIDGLRELLNADALAQF